MGLVLINMVRVPGRINGQLEPSCMLNDNVDTTGDADTARQALIDEAASRLMVACTVSSLNVIIFLEGGVPVHGCAISREGRPHLLLFRRRALARLHSRRSKGCSRPPGVRHGRTMSMARRVAHLGAPDDVRGLRQCAH